MSDAGIHRIPSAAAVVVDRNGNVAGWTDGAEAVLGFVGYEVVGRTCHQVLCGSTPDGEPVCHPWCTFSSSARGEPSVGELVLYPRSAVGEPLRVVMSVYRIGADDPARGWILHSIISAERLPGGPRSVVSIHSRGSHRRLARRPKSPDTNQD